MTTVRPALVFIDGIGGRRPLRRRLLRRFEGLGRACHHVDYRPNRASFETIRDGLGDRLAAIAARGPHVLIGYSFGGVLARAALASRADLAPPTRLVLVASPMHSMRLCRTIGAWPAFRWLTGDCGALLASQARMQQLALPAVPTTCLYGTRRIGGALSLAGRGPGDGFVSVAEIDPDRFDDAVAVHASHPFIATCDATLDAIEAIVSRPNTP